MSANLVNVSISAAVLIIGYYWYRRRCVDKVDPGGKKTTDKQYSRDSSFDKIEWSPGRDSGMHDESSSLNSTRNSCKDLSPSQHSASVNIPGKRSSPPQPIIMKSGKSAEESRRSWYNNEENDLPEVKGVKLGSNPKTNHFSMMEKTVALETIMQENHQDEVKLEKVAEEKVEKKVVKKQFTSGQGQVSERDSANHSPVSGVLEGSVTDEVRSEGSTDSGKGGSIKEHTGNFTSEIAYDFWVPQPLVGRLIGKAGYTLANIRQKTNVRINIKKHPPLKDFNICLIEGTPENIQAALDMIRRIFPENKYPNLTLEKIVKVEDKTPCITEMNLLFLVEGMNNDVIVCHVVKANHLFIQLPTHPTFPSLKILENQMEHVYRNTESPMLPTELIRGTVVAVRWYTKWVRASIETPDPTGEAIIVRLLDHGGYWSVSHSDMRRIRTDLLTLPFQAIEVFIGNVKPKDEEWHPEANNIVAQMCSGVVGQAQVVGYIDSSVFISLYFNVQKHGLISVADELIARGYAQPSSLEEMIPQPALPIM